MSTAIIFPGQGSQQLKMGFDFYNSFDESKTLFERADKALGYSITDIIFNGSDDELRLTANTQPALLTVSMVIWSAISHRISPSYFAGHSLGEYTAVTVAGGMCFEDTVIAVHNRGKFMQTAVPSGHGVMMAVLGMRDVDVIAVCEHVSEDNSIIEVANFNCDGQVVVAGHASAKERFIETAKKAGAKRVISLPVSAPFHCSLMEPAKINMEKYLKDIVISDLTTPIINNVDAEEVTSSAKVFEGLVRQVSGSVRWTESVQKMRSLGVKRFIEIGSGSVLTGLVKKIDSDVEVFNISTVEDLKKLD